MLLTRREFIKLGSAGLAGLALAGCSTSISDQTRNRLHIICMADLHSAHESLPRISGMIHQLNDTTSVPILILINGDIFEAGNVVALRSQGSLEWKFLERLQQVAQVVVNVGNHEGALEDDLTEVVERMQNLGIRVVSNIFETSTETLLAEPFTTVQPGGREVRIAGIATDDASTYREIHRNRWTFPDAEAYAADQIASILDAEMLNIVMDHDGILSDQAMKNSLPDGTLLLGGHDHLRLINLQDSFIGLHSGWWGAIVDQVTVTFEDDRHTFELRTYELTPDSPKDLTLLQAVQQAENEHLSSNEREVVAVTASPRDQIETMEACVGLLHQATETDCTLLNNTTFGAALPQGNIRRHDMNAVIRFDSGMMQTEVSGAQLETIRGTANQQNMTNWTQSAGEYVLGPFPETIDANEVYTLSVNAWIALDFNQQRFLGLSGLSFSPVPDLDSIREVVANGLS